MFRWTGGSSAALKRRRLPKKIILSNDPQEIESKLGNQQNEKKTKQKNDLFSSLHGIDEITGSVNIKRIYAKKNDIRKLPQKKQIIEADVFIPQRTKEQKKEIEMLNDIQDEDFDVYLGDESKIEEFNNNENKKIIIVERKEKRNYKNPPKILVSKINQSSKFTATKVHEIFDLKPDRNDESTQI